MSTVGSKPINSRDSSALQRKMVLFINLLVKSLTQDINGMEAPSDRLLEQTIKSVGCEAFIFIL